MALLVTERLLVSGDHEVTDLALHRCRPLGLWDIYDSSDEHER